jgi:putative Ca2+/H+ antiporter (TMEM165/GDT1 family)
MMTTPELFTTVFGVIFVAELPDKTALASLVLATRHRPLPVFLGAALALAVQSVVAVVAGQLFSYLPPRVVHVGAGVLFLVSAVFMWRRREDQDEGGVKGDRPDHLGFLRALWLVFTVIFVAEWGDLTQVATAGFAARYRAPVTIFLSATAALTAVAAIAVFVGNRAARVLNPHLTQRIAAVLFAGIGIALCAGLI